ncbi:hypothetical protein ACFQ0G_44480 [Streptomyces chiangmaiensis]
MVTVMMPLSEHGSWLLPPLYDQPTLPSTHTTDGFNEPAVVVDNGVKQAKLPADSPPYRRVHAFARRRQVASRLAERQVQRP